METLKVGDKIKALIDEPVGGNVKAGEIGTVISNRKYVWSVDFPSQKGYEITKFHLKHFELVNEKDDLLEEAKRRYPIGTKFIPAHVPEAKNHICEVYDYNTIEIHGNCVDLYSSDDRNGHSFTGRICHNGKWAEIVSKPEPLSAFKVGQVVDTIPGVENSEAYNHTIDDSINSIQRKECTITSIAYQDGYFWYKTDRSDNWFRENCLELSKWEPKEGDWVWTQANTRNKEELAIFIKPNDYGYTCFFENSSGKHELPLNTKNKNIRKALPHEIPVSVVNIPENLWVKPIRTGPNNTTHPKYKQSGFCGKEYKVIEHDKNSFPEYGGIYICEGGYCFYADFCQKIDKPTPQFEVGKWYKSNYHTNGKNHWYYLKVSGFGKTGRLNGERISKNPDTGEYIYEENKYWDCKETLAQAIKLGPLTDLSEIQAILPDDHPDKVKTKAEPMSYRGKFKVGDTVKCIGESSMGANGSSAGWRKDHVFTITEITNEDTDFPIAWNGIHGCGVYFDQLELFKDKCVAGIDPFGSSTTFKFQIGDEVRVGPVGCDVDHHGYYSSETGLEKIAGVSGAIGRIKGRITVNYRNYYNLSCHDGYSYISEDCLSFKEESRKWVHGTAANNKFEEYPLTPDECLIKPQIDAEVSKVKIKTKVPVTLKNTEKEVKINVKTNCSIKLN